MPASTELVALRDGIERIVSSMLSESIERCIDIPVVISRIRKDLVQEVEEAAPVLIDMMLRKQIHEVAKRKGVTAVQLDLFNSLPGLPNVVAASGGLKSIDRLSFAELKDMIQTNKRRNAKKNEKSLALEKLYDELSPFMNDPAEPLEFAAKRRAEQNQDMQFDMGFGSN